MNQETFDDVPEILSPDQSHLACAFVLDISGSMSGEKIRELNNGFNRFLKEAKDDKTLSKVLDVCVIQFDDQFDVVQQFTPVPYVQEINLKTRGGTKYVAPLREAFKLVNERAKEQQVAGTQPYKPWIIFMTDGENEHDDSHEFDVLVRDMQLEITNGKVNIIGLGIGQFSTKALHRVCNKQVLRVEDADFKEFFSWLLKSMRQRSQVNPNQPSVTPALAQNGNTQVDPFNPAWNF